MRDLFKCDLHPSDPSTPELVEESEGHQVFLSHYLYFYMPNYQEIRDLSNKPTLTSRHICDEHNITPNAIQAVHRGIAEGGSVKVLSSLIHGTKSPDLDSEPIDQDTTIAVGSVTKMFTSAALLKLWDQELTTKKADWWKVNLKIFRTVLILSSLILLIV